MMLPFSLQCLTCGEFMYRGKKFNCMKEDVDGDRYLGILKIRFNIKCITCNSQITFKTDPKNGDYEMEKGATRNFETKYNNTEYDRDREAQRDEVKAKEESGDVEDAMTSLEKRTLDSKLEMEIHKSHICSHKLEI